MGTERRRIRLILGTMTFGREVDEADADRMVGMFLDAGHRELDTAAAYADGRTEEILGRVLTPARRRKVLLATKVNPWGRGGLRPARVTSQLETSLNRLGMDRVDLLYLHAPDLRTPIESTLMACHGLREAGKFRQLGLSNYAAWQVVDIRHICRREGWMAPTVYQGMYNAVTRDVEPELFPSLRRLRMGFYAYNPLAGGLLTGKHVPQAQPPAQGRFALYPTYRDRYWRESYLRAISEVRETCHRRRVPMAEAALRWLRHHSCLGESASDGVLVGATRVEQLAANLKSWEAEGLPHELAGAFDAAWAVARPACPRYFRA